MNLRNCFLVLSLVLLSESAMGVSYSVASGMSKITQGRIVPLLQLSADSERYIAQFNSLGLKNDLYYQNAYKLSFLIKKKWGASWLQEMTSGYGLGLLYSKRGYREDTDEELTERDDVLIGGSFRIQWMLAKRYFIALDAFYATSGFIPLVLSFQNENTFTLGMRF